MTRVITCDECGKKIEEDEVKHQEIMHIKVTVHGTFEDPENEKFDVCSWECFDKQIKIVRALRT